MLAVKEFQTSGNDIDFEEVEMLLEAEDDSDPEEPVQLVSTHLDGDTGVTNKIKGAIYNVAKEFVYIGFLLHEVDIYEYYLEKGYSSVYEYAASELGWKKSSVNNFINVCRTFGRREPNSQVLYMGMQDGYEKFNYSQLCEMLSMNEKQREQITPDMTVKQIREVKKEDRALQMSGNEKSSVVCMTSAPVKKDFNQEIQLKAINTYWELPTWLVSKMSYVVDGLDRSYVVQLLDWAISEQSGCPVGYFNQYLAENFKYKNVLHLSDFNEE